MGGLRGTPQDYRLAPILVPRRGAVDPLAARRSCRECREYQRVTPMPPMLSCPMDTPGGFPPRRHCRPQFLHPGGKHSAWVQRTGGSGHVDRHVRRDDCVTQRHGSCAESAARGDRQGSAAARRHLSGQQRAGANGGLATPRPSAYGALRDRSAPVSRAGAEDLVGNRTRNLPQSIPRGRKLPRRPTQRWRSRARPDNSGPRASPVAPAERPWMWVGGRNRDTVRSSIGCASLPRLEQMARGRCGDRAVATGAGVTTG